MSRRPGRNDQAWEKIFRDENLAEQIRRRGFAVVEARVINRYREARLMAKFDHAHQLPAVFQDQGLNILPISRSAYAIGPFSLYHPVDYKLPSVMKKFTLPPEVTTLDPAVIASEATALHAALLSGMLTDVLGEPAWLTVSGRMTTDSFPMDFAPGASGPGKRDSILINVDRAQIEIDGGFETARQLALVEAKLGQVNDFFIRQLYYPFALWRRRTGKKIIPLFFTFSDDVFSFFRLNFPRHREPGSLLEKEQFHFRLSYSEIYLREVVKQLRTNPPLPPPDTPFPQADRLERVLDLLLLLDGGEADLNQVSENYQFTPRQARYYSDAARFLGLVDRQSGGRENPVLIPTDFGRQVLRSPQKNRHLLLIGRVLSHSPFRECFELYLGRHQMPAPTEIHKLMREIPRFNEVSDSTLKRRASTVRAWLDWVLRKIDDGASPLFRA